MLGTSARNSTFLLPLCLIAVATGCGGVRYEHAPIHYSPTASARWSGPLNEHARRRGGESPLRKQAVSFADKRNQAAPSTGDFGQRDVDALFDALGRRVDWTASRPLSDLIRAAERRNAYDGAALPLPGDIVLFHNQIDRNENRKSDDWLTGCGIVIARRGKTFFALARTGRGPRIVTVSPKTPSVRAYNGTLYNSYLRVPSPQDAADAVYLSGLLYAGRIDLLKLLSR